MMRQGVNFICMAGEIIYLVVIACQEGVVSIFS